MDDVRALLHRHRTLLHSLQELLLLMLIGVSSAVCARSLNHDPALQSLTSDPGVAAAGIDGR